MPALTPDVTVIHAQQADRRGNVGLWGMIGVQKEAVLAARGRIVTVEEVVDELDRGRGAVVLPSWVVTRSPSCPAAPIRASPGLLRPRQRLLPRLGRGRPRP